jgi:hypothetical protein
MKTVTVSLRIRVPDKTSNKRVIKLVELLLDVGLDDAAETLDREGNGGPVDSPNIRYARAVAGWTFLPARAFEVCGKCGQEAARLVKVKTADDDGFGCLRVCTDCAATAGVARSRKAAK